VPRFIELKDGAHVNADRVITMRDRKVKADDGDERTAVDVEYLGADGCVSRGEVAEDDTRATDLAESFVAQVVPAHPGYYGVRLNDDPPHRVVREVVLAWRVEQYGMEPLGLTGPLYTDVLLPDGRVESIVSSWDSLEEWRADKLDELPDELTDEAEEEDTEEDTDD
jgi:hypothetical protein